MSNDFRLIQANSLENSTILASMHSLRCQVFHHELHWTTGLNITDGKEFDQYDQLDTTYIVRIDANGDVDASCRLIPTSKPYMIAEHYPEFVEKIPIPHYDDIWEISRFCASEKARKDSKGRITGQLIAAAIEFGLTRNIKNYVALATDSIVPVIRRIAGWDPRVLGERRGTPNDFSYSVLYTVSPEMLKSVRQKNNINGYLLFDVPAGKSENNGENMERPQLTLIPQQIKDKPGTHQEEMESTISYLETVAFSRGYETMLAGLRLTRMVMQWEKNLSRHPETDHTESLQLIDKSYAELRARLAGESHE